MCIKTDTVPVTKMMYINNIQSQYTASLIHNIQTSYRLQRVKLDTISL